MDIRPATSFAISGPVVGGTANSILYVAGASPVLTQDNTNFTWNRDSVAGKGLYFNAGTAASAVSALQIKQEWSYNAAAIDAIDIVFTDTSSHANTNALRIRGGAAGATELMKLGKAGELTIGSTLFTPAASFINDTGLRIGNPTTYAGWSHHSLAGINIASATGIYAFGTIATLARSSGISEISAGLLGIGTGAAGSVAGGLALKHVNSYSQTTDAAPPVPLYRASNAYAQASTNPNGADVIIGPGIGRRFATVVDYSLIDAGADTITITVNGTPTVGTADAAVQDGTHWVIGASNNATATNIATWMSTISGVTGAAVGASAYATFGATVHTATIATNMDAGEGTVTSGADGLPYWGAPTNAAAAATATMTNAPVAANPLIWMEEKVVINGTLTTVCSPKWAIS